jgi:uncharacterized RDD family membrane protein YckC
MSAQDRYVQRVMDRVYATESWRTRLEEDLRARFEQAMADGESEAAVLQSLGTPEDVAEAFMADVELRYAGFWERTFAFLVDVALCLLVMLPFIAIGALLAARADSTASTGTEIVLISIVVSMGLAAYGVFVLYFPVLESRFGQTLGKRLMKIEVRSEAGARIGIGAAFLRRLPMYFKFLFIDALFVPFTAKKQRAFDIVAKTVVLRDPDSPSGPGQYLLCLALFVVAAVLIAAAVCAVGLLA